MAPKDPDCLSAQDVAALLGIGLDQTYEAAARGEIPCRRVGRRILFSRRAIEKWLHHEEERP
jgi:excisionase family DNA binding protein